MAEFLQICIGGLLVGTIYALIALGFSLIHRVTGAINLAQGGFALIGAPSGDRYEGTRSFRVADPDGRQVAIFYHYPA